MKYCPKRVWKHRLRRAVKVVNGGPLVETEQLPVPQVVKVDEAHEYAVIQGLRQTLSLLQGDLLRNSAATLAADVKPVAIQAVFESLGFGRIDVRCRCTTEGRAFGHKLRTPY